MSGGFYRINRDICAKYNLIGREAMVYNSLLYLCARGAYTGSAQDIADFSFCGKKMTALRMLSSLQQKGLIRISKDGISLAQIEPSSAQIETVSAQIETISKEEKENQKKKENIKKDNENSVCVIARENTPTSASPKNSILNRLFNMDVILPDKKNQVPANTGYYRIIVTEFGYMNPKLYVDEMYRYYNSHVWPRGNKLETMRWWMSQEPIKHPRRKPSLNDIERAVMKTFLDNIEERLIVRLFHVVRQFEVTDKVIYFYVPESNVNDFVLWLNTLPLKLWFEAYNRTVSVRSLKD